MINKVEYSLRQAENSDNVPIPGAFCFDSKSPTYYITPSSNTDPFSGKTNKYAECRAVEVCTIGAAVHVKFSAAGTAATTSDKIVPINTCQVFAVDADEPYLRIIENAGTAKCTVTELK